MASEWVRMRGSLLKNPKVIRMARFLSADRDFINWYTDNDQERCDEKCDVRVTVRVTVASLLSVWSVVNECITADEVVEHASLFEVDEMAGVPSFGKAMKLVGWLEELGEVGVRFPNFNEHNTSERDRKAKSGAQRTKEWRDRHQPCDVNVTKCDEPVTSRCDDDVTKCDALEKSRVEKNKEEEIHAPAKPASARFVPPSVEQVQAYCQERRNAVNPVAFVAYYTSNGWKVGRNPMRNWRAAVVTWEKNPDFGRGRSPPTSTPAGNTRVIDRQNAILQDTLKREREADPRTSERSTSAAKP